MLQVNYFISELASFEVNREGWLSDIVEFHVDNQGRQCYLKHVGCWRRIVPEHNLVHSVSLVFHIEDFITLSLQEDFFGIVMVFDPSTLWIIQPFLFFKWVHKLFPFRLKSLIVSLSTVLACLLLSTLSHSFAFLLSPLLFFCTLNVNISSWDISALCILFLTSPLCTEFAFWKHLRLLRIFLWMHHSNVIFRKSQNLIWLSENINYVFGEPGWL